MMMLTSKGVGTCPEDEKRRDEADAWPTSTNSAHSSPQTSSGGAFPCTRHLHLHLIVFYVLHQHGTFKLFRLRVRVRRVGPGMMAWHYYCLRRAVSSLPPSSPLFSPSPPAPEYCLVLSRLCYLCCVLSRLCCVVFSLPLSALYPLAAAACMLLLCLAPESFRPPPPPLHSLCLFCSDGVHFESQHNSHGWVQPLRSSPVQSLAGPRDLYCITLASTVAFPCMHRAE